MNDKTLKIRKKLLINKEYQFQFIKIVLAQTLITSLLLVGVFYFFQRNQMEFFSHLSLDQQRLELMEKWTGSMFVKILGVVAVACLVQCCIALVVSHRSAGPMFRLKRYLNEISSGASPQPLQFRREDQFKDVQDAYNEMVTVLEKERQNDLRIIQQMEDGIAHLKKMAKDEHVFQLADYIDRLNNDLKNFKTH